MERTNCQVFKGGIAIAFVDTRHLEVTVATSPTRSYLQRHRVTEEIMSDLDLNTPAIEALAPYTEFKVVNSSRQTLKINSWSVFSGTEWVIAVQPDSSEILQNINTGLYVVSTTGFDLDPGKEQILRTIVMIKDMKQTRDGAFLQLKVDGCMLKIGLGKYGKLKNRGVSGSGTVAFDYTGVSVSDDQVIRLTALPLPPTPPTPPTLP
jgi:hypothetical protein